MSKEYIISACSGMKIDVKQGQSITVIIIPYLSLSNCFNKALCRDIHVLLNGIGFAGLYLLPNETLIFKLSGVNPVPLSTKTYPSYPRQKHNSIFPK